MGNPFIDSIYGFESKNLVILRQQIYINVTKKIAFLLNVRSRDFTKSYLSDGLYNMPIRTVLDLGRKISTKMLSVLMQKLGFQLYEL